MIQRTSTRPIAIAVLALLVVALTAMSGCGIVDSEPDTTSVFEQSGTFHFLVPADWQHQVSTGLITVYAGDELPDEEQALDSLTMIAITARAESSTPVAELLTTFVDGRAESRDWTDTSIGEPQAATVGGRDAMTLDAQATDGNGVAFAGTFYLTRTDTLDILVMAVAPEGDWSDFEEDIRRIAEEDWFWHDNAGSSETTGPAE